MSNMGLKNGNLEKSGLLTTGQIATMCGVSPRTVTKWFDTGQLVGFRVPSPSGAGGDRRVHRNDLLRFARQYGISLAGTRPTVLVGWDHPPPDWPAVTCCPTVLSAGLALALVTPGTIVVDAREVGRPAAAEIGREAKANRMWRGVRLYAVLADDAALGDALALKHVGYDDVMVGAAGMLAARKMVREDVT